MRYLVIAALLAATAVPAAARKAGDILIRADAHTVQPKSNNGESSALAADAPQMTVGIPLASISRATRLTVW